MNRDRLREALDELESDGTLDASRRAAVEARLAPLVPEARDRAAAVTTIVVGLGGVSLAASLLFFIASNWEELGRGAKLAIGIGAFLGLHLLGYWFAEKPGHYPRTGRALTFAAVAGFGGVIFLIAQVYHLESHHAHALLLWWLLNVPIVLLTRSNWIAALVTALFSAWVLIETDIWFDDHDVGWRYRWFVEWLTLAPLGALLKGVRGALLDTRFASIERPLRLLATPVILAGIYALSFRELTDSMDAGDWRWELLLPFALVGGAALLPALWLLARPARRADGVDAVGVLLAGVAIALTAWRAPWATFITANAALLGVLFVLIARGVQKNVRSYVNYGVLGFLVVVISRYFEYLVELEIDLTLAYLGAGVLLIGTGLFLERRRRAWLAHAARRST